MEELCISHLSLEHIEEMVEIAEDAARKHIISKVPKRGISDLSISIEVDGKGPTEVTVEIDLDLSRVYSTIDTNKIAKESVQAAFESIETYLRKSNCQSER